MPTSIEGLAFVDHWVCFGLIVLMKIVCFLLGYFTIRLGYDLIARGVQGEFKFAARLGGAKADLASLSPGLLFVLLGVFLIGYAIYVKKEAPLTITFGPKGDVPQVKIPTESPFGGEEAQKTP